MPGQKGASGRNRESSVDGRLGSGLSHPSEQQTFRPHTSYSASTDVLPNSSDADRSCSSDGCSADPASGPSLGATLVDD